VADSVPQPALISGDGIAIGGDEWTTLGVMTYRLLPIYFASGRSDSVCAWRASFTAFTLLHRGRGSRSCRYLLRRVAAFIFVPPRRSPPRAVRCNMCVAPPRGAPRDMAMKIKHAFRRKKGVDMTVGDRRPDGWIKRDNGSYGA